MSDRQGGGSASGQESQTGATGLGNDSQSSGNANTTNPPAGNQGNSGNSGSTDISALLSRIASLEEQTKEIPKLRQEAAKYRTKLKTLASDDDSNSGQNSSGASSEVSAELQSLREGRIRDQLTLAADKAGAHAPNEIYRYFNLLEIAESDGSVKNADKLLADLRKSYPFLFKPPVDGNADGNSGARNTGNPGDMNSIIRQGFRSMRGIPN